MKKKRVPASIDKEIHRRIKRLIKMHPELEYKKISRFVNEALEEKLDKIEDKLMLKSIRKAGLDSIVSEVKDFRRSRERSEALADRLSKKVDEILKRKHTHGVYKSKKK